MNQLTTRRATLDDIPRLTELLQEQTAIIRQLDPRYGGHAHDAPTTALQAAIVSDTHHVYVANRTDSPVLGYIIGQTEPAAAVQQLVIDAHFGSRGVGTALLDALTGAFRTDGITTYTVAVPRNHAVQQAFWRAKGAIVIATDAVNRTETMQIYIKDGQ